MPIDRRTVIIGAAGLAAVGTAAGAAPDSGGVQMNTPTERVLGIGGLFFRSRDPKKLVKVDPEKSPYGRFARQHDPDGNPIELWEPASPA